MTQGSQNSVRETTSNRALLRGSLAGVTAQGLYLATRFLLTPYVVAQAGYEAYGFWSILFVVLGVVGIHRMGLLSSSVTFVARDRALGDIEHARATLRTTASLALVLVLLVGLPMVALADPITGWMGAEGALRGDAALTLRIALIATCTALVLGGYQSALEAYQRFVHVRSVDVACQGLEALLIVVFLSAGMGLVGLALAYAVRILLPILFHAGALHRIEPRLSALPGRIDRPCAREVLRLGGSIQLMGALHMGIAMVPRVAMAHIVGLAAVGVFEVGRKLVEFAAALPTHALAPLVPATAEDETGSGAPSARVLRLTHVSTRLIAFAGALPLSVLAVFADEVVLAWLGEPRPEVALVLRILAPAAWLHLVTGPATSVLRGLARPGAELRYSIAWFVALLLTCPAALAWGGLAGGVACVAIIQTLACMTLFAQVAKPLELGPHSLWSNAVLPLAVCVLPALVIGSAIDVQAQGRAEALLAIALGATAATAVAAPAFFFLAWTGKDRRALLGLLPSRLRPRSLASEANA